MTNRFDDLDQETLDLFGDIATDAATRSFPFVTLVVPGPGRPPDWRVGDLIITDEEAIALADESAMGWVRIVNNKRVEEHFIRQLGNKKPSRPNSFTDKAKWETWNNGKAKDPWNYQTKLALKITTGELAGKVVTFDGKNEATRAAIGDVQRAFTEKRRRPLVRLTSVKRDGENAFDPVLQIIRYTEDDSVIPGLNLAKDSEAAALPPPLKDDEAAALSPPQTNGGGGRDMDDDIPF